MAVDETAVRVTLRDVYEVAVRTEQTVALLVQSDKDRADGMKDHESRLRDLEKKVWALPSIATVIALAGLVLSLVKMAAGG